MEISLKIDFCAIPISVRTGEAVASPAKFSASPISYMISTNRKGGLESGPP